MNQLLTTIVASHVLLHTVFGCCWHPAHHPAADGCAATESSRPATCACHAYADGSHQQPCQDEDAPDGQHACCHDQCKWISESGAADIQLLALSYWVTFPGEYIVLPPPAKSVEPLAHVDCLQPAALPVRTHLAFGQLLI